MTIRNLIDRLRKATGPDREIDKELFVLQFGRPPRQSTFEQYEPSEKVPRYTEIFNDALTLLPELNEKLRPITIAFAISESGKKHAAWIENWAWGKITSGQNGVATPAIALTIAALEAREGMEKVTHG